MGQNGLSYAESNIPPCLTALPSAEPQRGVVRRKPHQCDIRATPKRVGSQAIGTPKPPQCDPKAPSKPPQCVPSATGVRPSPGAASSNLPGTLESSKTPLLSEIAAPEDGRTPTQAGPPVGGRRKMRPGRAVEGAPKKRVAFRGRTWHIFRPSPEPDESRKGIRVPVPRSESRA